MDIQVLVQAVSSLANPAVTFIQNNPIVMALAAFNVLVFGLRFGISRGLNRQTVPADDPAKER